MPRFVHTADWQIGRQYGRFAEEDASVLADARFVAIERLAQLGCREQATAILVAGDVFDTQTVSNRTLRRTFEAMAGFSGPWILIPGNHDAALAESVWTRAARLQTIPDNAHVLTKPQVRAFPELGFAVLPAPLTQRQTHEDLTEWFDHADSQEGLLRIGLAHGSVTGHLPEAADATNPIAADRATRARLDYLALGDWHGCKRIDARTWYSGTPEQERFKDNGAGQALLIDIAAAGAEPRVRAQRVGQYEWLQQRHSLAIESDLAKLLADLEALPSRSVVDLVIDGHLDLAGHEQLRQALSVAAGRHRSLQYDLAGLRLQPTDDDIAALRVDGYVGEVVSELRDRQQAGDDPEMAREALAILATLLREQHPEADA